MNKLLLSFLLSLVLLFSSSAITFAKLYINEFSSYTTDSDWVEIYNSDTNPVDLNSYCFRDGSQSNKLLLSGIIQPGGFLTFDWNDKLNKSGDTFKLFVNCDETQDPADQISYGEDKDVSAPKENQTAGRTPDGGDMWVLFSLSTKNQANSSQIFLTATPTPTDLPTPTNTPTITRTPTPSKTPNPTKIPTSTKTPTSVKSQPTTTPADSQKIKATSASQITPTLPFKISGMPTSVLGTKSSTIHITNPPEPKKLQQKTLVKGSDNTFSPFIFLLVGGGILIVSCAILGYLRIRKKSLNL